jgi:hypothetical protein
MFLSAAVCSVLCKSCLSIKIIATVYTTSTQTYDNPADKIVIFNQHLPPQNLQFCQLEQQIIFQGQIIFEVIQNWRFYFRFLVQHCTAVWRVTFQKYILPWTSKIKFRAKIWTWKALCRYNVPDNMQQCLIPNPRWQYDHIQHFVDCAL